MRTFQPVSIVLALIGAFMLPATAVAQFGSTQVPGVTSGIVTQAITDAISGSVREVLNARPVVDRSKVEGVTGVAVVPQSGHMATALEDGSVGVWDLGQGIEKARLKGHSGEVKEIVVSQTADKAVSLGADGKSQVWSMKSGRKLATFDSGADAGGLAVSADGTFAVTGHGDGSARLWDAATGAERRSFATNAGALTTLALDGKDAVLAAGNGDGTVWVWGVADGAQLASFKAHDGTVTALKFIADGSRFATTGADGRIIVWNAQSGAEAAAMATEGGAAKSIAATVDGTRIAAGGEDGKVRLYDVTSGQLVKTFEAHDGAITSVTFGKDDAVIHTASRDGTSRILERDKGAELAQIVSSEDGWAVFNMNGDYEGEGSAVEAVTWVADDAKFDMDQFAESHYEPGVLAHAAAGEAPAKVEEKPVLSVKFATPPAIAFQTPEEDEDSDEEDYTVEVTAADLGGGIVEIRLFQNGKLVHSEKEDFDDVGETVEHEFDVKLVPGKNEFRTVALSRDFIESRPAKVKVKYSGAERKSRLHLLTVGINTYRNPALNLNYGVPDANGLRTFFGKQPKRLFTEVTDHSVADKQATKGGITKAIARLNDTRPEDVVVLYFAGHGDTVDGKWYFLPYEVAYPEKEEEVRSKGIPASQINDWVQEIPAQKVVVLMDACKSGAALKKFRGFEDRKALRRLAHATGVHVLAAAAKTQFAVELKELGHGAFTYVVLEGLQGKADGGGDGTITVRELTNFVESRLPDLSEEMSGEAQFPVINSKGNDFPLAVGS